MPKRKYKKCGCDHDDNCCCNADDSPIEHHIYDLVDELNHNRRSFRPGIHEEEPLWGISLVQDG